MTALFCLRHARLRANTPAVDGGRGANNSVSGVNEAAVQPGNTVDGIEVSQVRVEGPWPARSDRLRVALSGPVWMPG